MILNILSIILVVVGLLFFTAGTIGLIRFPDIRSQLHALTKADNLGLGLVLLGVAVYSRSVSVYLILLVVWLMALGAASVSAQLLAGVERVGDST